MLKKLFGFLMVTSILASLLSACGASSAANDARKLLTDLTAKGRLTVNQPGWVHVIENIVYDTDSTGSWKITKWTGDPPGSIN